MNIWVLVIETLIFAALFTAIVFVNPEALKSILPPRWWDGSSR
jgi:hypothetical protein